MKILSIKLLLYFLCFSVIYTTFAQEKPKNLNDDQFSTFYRQRLSLFRKLPPIKNSIIFLGNSITNGSEWSELFQNPKILNRGISGDITAGVLNRLDEITDRKPQKIFLLIGVNDLAKNISPDSVLKNIFLSASIIHQRSPKTELYIQSILPVSDAYHLFTNHTHKTPQILQINAELSKNERKYAYQFINLYPYFVDNEGKLDKKLSNDGLHLTGSGYLLWQKIINKHINKGNESPALIPFPQTLKPNGEEIYLHQFTNIIAPTDLKNEAKFLQKSFPEKLKINGENPSKNGNILLSIEKNTYLSEGYHLSIKPQQIHITASDSTGIFYGIQTLLQLCMNKTAVMSCEIDDAPAFKWRGYMIDVGRNFQNMETIKQQIDKMAFYKLNVLHFHATEDVAWRFAIKKYPQLTEAKNMTRQKGKFYTEKDIKELIDYCKERHILFLPEIDMPGHSQAFERTFGFSMQSEKGVAIVKNILKEVLQTYKFPYLHIGGDEVKITNTNFLPEMSDLITSFGTKIIGWVPGGNLSKGTIQQLWMKDIPRESDAVLIDSRHTYINHFDPEESVVTLFNRQFLATNKGDEHKIGAELCLWHDRNTEKETDLFTMNPVYPSMLAFAERIWKGGGEAQITAHINLQNQSLTQNFYDFEQRLIKHKDQYFETVPFNYVAQAAIHWKLIGPYENQGNLTQKFAPEKIDFDFQNPKNVHYANGATVVVRHFWAPFINANIDSAKENTTWYAYTRVWSETTGKQKVWMGAYDVSRSTPSFSFHPKTWNDIHTQFYINGREIDAPLWKQQPTGNLEIPFTNEGYSYRTPTMVDFKKGWNEILVKMPMGELRSDEWYKYTKWQFTFVPIQTSDKKVHTAPLLFDAP